MSQQDLQKNINHIYSLVSKRRLLESMSMLKQLLASSDKDYFKEELDRLEITYTNILRHSFGEVIDPERDKILHQFLRNLLELLDTFKESTLAEDPSNQLMWFKKQIERDSIRDPQRLKHLLDNIRYDNHLQDILDDIPLESNPGTASFSREAAIRLTFNHIWMTDKFNNEELKSLKEASDNTDLLWHEEALITSAISMSLFRFFHLSKIDLLIYFVRQGRKGVWERALTGLVLALYIYNSRVNLYPTIKARLMELSLEPNIIKSIEAIILQLTRSKDTEKVRKKWEHDILPEVMKMQPRIEEKLKLDNILGESFDEDKNPDWEKFFEETPDLLDKLQQMTEMQLEGVDVFMGAFSQLKQFPFFQDHSNWFVPFYAQNSAVNNLLGQMPPPLAHFLEKLENTRFICNSDKYSFCFNLAFIPDEQKSMMANMMGEELKGYETIENDASIIDDFAQSKGVFIQYVQDLYRFFKLHPWRRHLTDPFDKDLEVYNTHMFDYLEFSDNQMNRMASYYFEKGYYQDASCMFQMLLNTSEHPEELHEKIGYCHQKNMDYAHALDFYQKAEAYGSQSVWLRKQMALCYKNLGMWDKALDIYKSLELLNPDDLNIQAQAGQCLIHLEKHQEALNYYFKIEVLAPENEKIRRPLAWCSFLLGKLDTAADYLERLLQTSQPNAFDLMNFAHVQWCLGKPSQAASYYQQSMLHWQDSKDFFQSFREDRKHLIKGGISETDIDLMADFLRNKKREENSPLF